MEKNSRNVILTSILILTLLLTTFLMSGCGKETSTLEEYVNNNEELAKEIESYSADGMSIDITDNTLTYTYKYEQTFDETTASLMGTELEKSMSSIDSTFQSMRDTLNEESGISDITVKIVYADGNNTVLYEKEY